MRSYVDPLSGRFGRAECEDSYATWTYRFTAIVVLEDCFVGRMLAYGSSGPLLRRLIILTSQMGPHRWPLTYAC